MSAASSTPSLSKRFPAMSRNGARDLLRFIGAALMAGLISSLVLMVTILFLASSAYV